MITEINNKEIKNFNDIKYVVENSPGNFLKFKILRNKPVTQNNKQISIKTYSTLYIKPVKHYSEVYKKNIGRIGITAYPGILTKLSFNEALYLGLSEYLNMTLNWFKGFKALISGEVNKKDIVGPIGIAKISGSVIEKGVFDVLILMAIMSINLGLINLLPIPVLDGGQLCFYIYESIFKKPISNKVQRFLLQFGFIFLMSLMLLVTAFDLGL